MNCPACGSALSELNAGEVTVDLCRAGCGGVWFDNRELRKVDEPTEGGDLILAAQQDAALQVDATQRRKCPKCQGVVMMRHFHSARKSVEVDTCPNCNGCWLDRGELAKIREEMGDHKIHMPGEAEPRPVIPDVPAEFYAKHAEEVADASIMERVLRFFGASARGGF